MKNVKTVMKIMEFGKGRGTYFGFACFLNKNTVKSYH